MQMTNKVLLIILEELNILKTSKTKPIVDAIKNRNPVTFYYSGQYKPKKDSVKRGTRVRAEVVALGLSKKGNLVMRAWVQPPSVSKKGFSKHGWRTFMLSRMSNVVILDNETFDSKRPQYKEGNDKSMSVTYVTTDWTKTPKTKKITKPEKTVEPEKPEISGKRTKPKQPEIEPKKTVEPEKPEISGKQTKPEVKPTENKPEELPQPKPKEKPEKTPSVEKTPEEKPEDLPQPKPEEKPDKNPEEENDETLKESIKKIKRLMFL